MTPDRKSFMVATETYLRTQQVADALGVSVSSVKRWVDSGELEATRTMGRHRLILLSSALDFARRKNFTVDGLAILSDEACDFRADEQIREDLIAALKVGATDAAFGLIFASHRSDRGGDGLADRIIQPVMARIGQGWLLGSWETYQERQATRILSLAIGELIARTPRAPLGGSPLALGGSIEGDHYSLPGLLGELVLREVGWDARNFGPNLPLRSFARAIRDQKPGLVFLSVSHIPERAEFLRDYAFFYEAATLAGAAVILGGRALDPELRSKLLYASFGDRMAHLAEFGRKLLPLARPVGAAEPDHHGTSPTLD